MDKTAKGISCHSCNNSSSLWNQIFKQRN